MSARKVDPSILRAARKLCQLDDNRWSAGVAGVYLRHARVILRAAGRYVELSDYENLLAEVGRLEKALRGLVTRLDSNPRLHPELGGLGYLAVEVADARAALAAVKPVKMLFIDKPARPAGGSHG